MFQKVFIWRFKGPDKKGKWNARGVNSLCLNNLADRLKCFIWRFKGCSKRGVK